MELTIIRKTGFGTEPAIISKVFNWVDGALVTSSEQCGLSQGVAKHYEAVTTPEFANLIGTMASSDAIILGTFKGVEKSGDGRAIKTVATAGKGEISRSRACFEHRVSPGLILIDHDTKGMPAHLQEFDFIPVIKKMLGMTDDNAWVLRGSTSAGLTHNGQIIAKKGGWHLYIPVLNKADSKRVLETLRDRLWNAGYGWIMIGEDGSRHVRSPVDILMWKPENLVFEGAGVIHPPLIQNRPPVTFHDGPHLDTSLSLRPTTPDETDRAKALIEAAKAAILPASDAVLDVHAGIIAFRDNRPKADVIREHKQAQDKGMLSPDHMLHFDDTNLGSVTVATVLADLSKYVRKTLKDPLEPQLGHNKAMVLAGIGRSPLPIVDSFAHGGRRYTLPAIGLFNMPDVSQFPPGLGPQLPALRPTLSPDTKAMLSPEVVNLAVKYKLDGDEDGYAGLVTMARSQKVKEDFTDAVTRGVKQVRMAEKIQASGTVGYDVSNPNDSIGQAAAIERDIAKRELAFVFGGAAVVMKSVETQLTTTLVRDSVGKPALNPAGDQMRIRGKVTTGKLNASHDAVSLALQVGYFTKEGELGPFDVCVPGQLLSTLKSQLGTTLPHVSAIVNHPVLWGNEILTGEGVYHAGSGLFLQTGYFPPVERYDPAEAYKYLAETWLGDFAFAEPLDALKTLLMPASMLVAKTSLLREPGPPIFMDTAPTAGSGKTFKNSVCHCGITGQPAPTLAFPDEPEELNKLILAAIMEGTLSFDPAIRRDRGQRVAHVLTCGPAIEPGDRWRNQSLLAAMRSGNSSERVRQILNAAAVRQVNQKRAFGVQHIPLQASGNAGQRVRCQRPLGAQAMLFLNHGHRVEN